MSEILRYVLVDADDTERDTEYETLHAAISAADGTQAVISRTYVYDDSELVWTPGGENFWPPKNAEGLVSE